MGCPGCIWGPTDGGGARRGGDPARTMVEDDTAGLQGQAEPLARRTEVEMQSLKTGLTPREREQRRCWREGGAWWSQRCGGLRHSRRPGSQEWEGGADGLTGLGGVMGLEARGEARGFV